MFCDRCGRQIPDGASCPVCDAVRAPARPGVLRVGREADNDLVVDAPGASRYHVEIVSVGPGAYRIRDLGTSNGTFVNGQRITETMLRRGDRVSLGRSEIDPRRLGMTLEALDRSAGRGSAISAAPAYAAGTAGPDPYGAAGYPGAAPPPEAMHGTSAGGRDVKVLVAGILAAVAVIPIVVSLLSHSWLRHKETSSERFLGLGLWSSYAKDGDEEETQSLSDIAEHAGSGKGEHVKQYCYVSMMFCVIAWGAVLAALTGAIFAFVRHSDGRGIVIPTWVTLAATSAAVGGFLLWFFVGVLASDYGGSREDLVVGNSVLVFWLGALPLAVASFLLGMVRWGTAAGRHGA